MQLSGVDVSRTFTKTINIIPFTLRWKQSTVENRSTINPSNVRYLVIHHALANTCSIEDIHRWHQDERGWAGVGYNFFVRKDGTVYEGRGLKYQGVHATGFNYQSMGICLEGNYDIGTPPTVQLEATKNLCIYLMGRFSNLEYNYGRLITHNSTYADPSVAKSCPGVKFPMSTLKNLVKDQLASKGAVIASTSSNDLGVNSSDIKIYITESRMTLEQIANINFTTVETLRIYNTDLGSSTVVPAGKSIAVPRNFLNYAADTSSSILDFASGLMVQSKHSSDSAYIEESIEETYATSNLLTAYGNVSDVYSQKQEYLKYKKLSSVPNITTINNLDATTFGQSSMVRGDIETITDTTDYDKMSIVVETADDTATFKFKIDPTASVDNKSRKISTIDTKGGAIIVDRGKNLGQKQLSGQMLDYNGNSEKYDFIDFYETYIESGNYKSIYLSFEGAVSLVELTNVSIQDNARNNIIKQYSLSFIIISENRGSANRASYASSDVTSASYINEAYIHSKVLEAYGLEV